MARLWRGVIPTAGSILHLHQRAGVALVDSDGISGMLWAWTLTCGGVAEVKWWHGWFAVPDFCLSGCFPLIFTFPKAWRLSCLVQPTSVGPVLAFQLVRVQRVECSNRGRLVLSPTEAFPTGASRGRCLGAEEHFPVGAGGQ